MKCPNCGHEQPDGATECVCCQVIFEKLQQRNAAKADAPKPPAGQSKKLPFFHGLACMTWSSNRLYRVYILPGELVFIWAASGGDGEKIMGRQFGLVGALTAALTTTGEEENSHRREVMDGTALNDLISDNEHNFRATREDFLEASLEPRSLWLHMVYGQITHKGVFRFQHREKGKFALCIQTDEDLQLAAANLPAALGGKLHVAIQP
jgi:hypothetical protein